VSGVSADGADPERVAGARVPSGESECGCEVSGQSVCSVRAVWGAGGPRENLRAAASGSREQPAAKLAAKPGGTVEGRREENQGHVATTIEPGARLLRPVYFRPGAAEPRGAAGSGDGKPAQADRAVQHGAGVARGIVRAADEPDSQAGNGRAR